jgi:hypothetical protein
MAEPNLLEISIIAFLAVFTLLGVLAGLMAALTRLFPGEMADPDAALLAGVAAAASVVWPGMRITKVEEVR